MSCTWLSNLSFWPFVASFAIALTCAWLSDNHSKRN